MEFKKVLKAQQFAHVSTPTRTRRRRRTTTGSVPYVLLFIVHMYYDIHDRVCTTVDSHKYYAYFANSHMYYCLSLECTTVQTQSLISSTIYYSTKGWNE